MQLVRGWRNVLDHRSALVELAVRTGQEDALVDLEYFLRLPQSTPKEACLVRLEQDTSRWAASNRRSHGGSGPVLAAAVMVFLYRVLGVGCRVYSTADTTGRRTVIAPPDARVRVVAEAARFLMQSGAQIALLSLRPGEDPGTVQASINNGLGGIEGAEWTMQSRVVPLYLPLADSYDRTLAKIGQRTRSNLRYYRRRAEKDLGAEFIPDARLSLQGFLSFNRECKYAVSEDLARWRFKSLNFIQEPFLHGVRDRNGRWLGLVCGRKQGGVVEIDWQCNRDDLPAYSLSTVIRSYLIEHEIGQGSKRLYIEGGTPNPIRHSFVCEDALDLTVVRRTLYTRAIRRLSPKDQFPKNHVSQVIADPRLTWHRV